MAEDRLTGLLRSLYPSLKETAVALEGRSRAHILFFSISDGQGRASVVTVQGASLSEAWRRGGERVRHLARNRQMDVRWLRVDHVDAMEATTWGMLRELLARTKRNYFRLGIALDAECRHGFLETEINANAMLYGGPKIDHCIVNEKNVRRYARLRHGLGQVDLADDAPVWLFSSRGLFVADGEAQVHRLHGPGPDAGRRAIAEMRADDVHRLIDDSSRYLGRQIGANGRFHYGWHPCFGRAIDAYNGLRHASSLYALIEAWDVTGDPQVKAAIDRGLTYLTQSLIVRTALASGVRAAFLVDERDEIKLGGNAVCLLALVKYTELTGDRQYLPLLEELATGILSMQDEESGAFVHVLHHPSLAVKDAFRIIYYDGEAAFGLMRLFDLTGDPRWIAAVERAFGHFIRQKHWNAHDHWLSYCVNELTRHRPERAYFEFGIRNFATYLDFVIERITTFPTLLELMMAAEQMIGRLQDHPDRDALLAGVDLDKFHHALHKRAHHMLNGHFWPELAMYFEKPGDILGSFFIRHHGFRVRIDDVEHYLSGYVAYWKFLVQRGVDEAALVPDPVADGPVVAWGGDVNLGRRQHYRTARLGVENILRVPALRAADLRIVNLECVVATGGEQGVRKGEEGPYYYRARPEMLRVLAQAGIDVVVTANNHSGDYGPEALLEQGRWLDAAGIGHTGSGKDLEAALTPVIRRAGDLNVAIFALDATQPGFAATADRPGSAHLPLNDPALWREMLAPRIAAARARAQVVLVAVHWGENLAAAPDADEVAVGRALIDAGADGVLGSSAHVLQGIELHRGRPIIHDAGDLLFDSMRGTLSDSGLFSLELSANGVERVTFTPIGGGFGHSRQREGVDAAAATRRFAALCRNMGTGLALTASGAGTIGLSPPPRPAGRVPAMPVMHATPLRPEDIAGGVADVDGRWLADEVPDDARIAPVRLGPLTLLGVRVKPGSIRRRRMLWVETFWRADAAVDEDIRLDIRGVPVAPTSMKPWGAGMDHDPCDWLLPTTRWKPGQVYRDYYGLRPPYLKDWVNVDLQLTVGIVSEAYAVSPVALPHIVTLALPKAALPGAGAAARSYRTQFPDIVRHGVPGETWTADQLAAVTGGTWLVRPPPGWHVRSVIRGFAHVELVEGPILYVASDYDTLALHEQYSTPGRRWDTHGSLKRRAGLLAGAIVAKPVAGLPKDFPVLQVDDPVRALIELGLAARQRFDHEVVAVTGTAGKSTTVGMLRHLLGGKTPALASFGNYNSRVGAPAVMANLSPDHEAAIIEVAQSALWMKRGPITRLLRPTIALITEIGLSQTDRRGASVEDTAKWKSRIFDGLTGAAIAIVGEHLAHFEMVMAAAQAHAKRVVTFGESDRATLRILERTYGAHGSRIRIGTPEGTTIAFDVPLPGPGMANNALAAMSVLYAMGRDLEAGTHALTGIAPEEGRLRRLTLPVRPQGTADIIDDSWNATVSSMLNAIAVFANMPAAGEGRRIAVLGRIVHLGDLSRALHESLAAPLLAASPDSVVTHGEEMHSLRAVLPEHVLGPHFSSAAALAAYLHDELRAGDLVLLKGSRRDSDFGEVCRLLTALSEAPAGAAAPVE
ncbi:CapA family protein [Sphingobium aquiterrae]|uniref:CapA family protein n=1 Tax=Sphingobium aquiterrae TaxID=2038656 RepID=UPI003019D6F3